MRLVLGLCLALLLPACGGASAAFGAEGLSGAGDSGSSGAQGGEVSGAGQGAATVGGGAVGGAGSAGSATLAADAGGSPSVGSVGGGSAGLGSGGTSSGTGGAACVPDAAHGECIASAGAAGAGCAPKTCDHCGIIPDGCNGKVDCGPCACDDAHPCAVHREYCSAASGGMCIPLDAGCSAATSPSSAVCVQYPTNDITPQTVMVTVYCPSEPPAAANCTWSRFAGANDAGCWVCSEPT